MFFGYSVEEVVQTFDDGGDDDDDVTSLHKKKFMRSCDINVFDGEI